LLIFNFKISFFNIIFTYFTRNFIQKENFHIYALSPHKTISFFLIELVYIGTGKEGYDRNKNMIISFTWVEGKFCLIPAIEISFFCCIILKAIQFFSLSSLFPHDWLCIHNHTMNLHKKRLDYSTHIEKWNKSFPFIFAGFWGLFC